MTQGSNSKNFEKDIQKIFIGLLFLAGLIVSFYAGYCQAHRALLLAESYVEHHKGYVSDEIYYVDVARRYLIYIFKIHDIDFYNSSGRTGEDYFNLEHPPLGKYLIALSMIVCGDRPLCWRIPGIIEAFLIPVIIYFTFARRNSTLSIITGGLGALLAGSDIIIHRDASVALLDIHLAFFTALTILALGRNHETLAAIFSGLAFMVKMSGAAAVGAVFFYLILKYLSRRDYKLIIKTISRTILIVFIVGLIIYSPLIAYFGPQKIISETSGALRWHTTSRPEGPPTSTPIGWLLNTNPFVFSYSLVEASARTTSIIELTAFIVSVIMLAWSVFLSLNKKFLNTPGSYTLIAIFLMYAVIWILGNHTFYSFYAVQLAPAAASALSEFTLYASALTSRGK